MNSSTNDAICDLMGENGNLKAELYRISAERDELAGELGAAVLTRDVWRSGHDAIYAELQQVKGDKKELHRRNGILSQERVNLHGDNAKLQSDVERLQEILASHKDCEVLVWNNTGLELTIANLTADRDTWKARYHNKTLRFNAVRARAKVDMARLAAQLKVEEDKNDKFDSECLVHAANGEADLAAANATISRIRAIVGSNDVISMVERMAEELTQLRLASKGDTGRGDK